MPRTPPNWTLALALLAGAVLWSETALPPKMDDIFHIQYAAYQWQVGEPEHIYTSYENYDKWMALHHRPVAERLGATGVGPTHYYPPFFAAALSPIAHYSAVSWRNAVLALNVALLAVFAWLILTLCEIRASPKAFLWALALVLANYPMARATVLGQVVPLQAAITWLAVIGMRRGRDVGPGIALGAISAVKLFPFGFAALAVFTGRVRLAVVWLATAGVLYAGAVVWLGWEIHVTWWNALQEFRSVDYSFAGNQSLPGWISRTLLGNPVWTPFVEPSAGIWLVRILCAAVFAAATLGTLWYRRGELHGSGLYYGMGLLIAGTLLPLPVAWEHYTLFLLPVVGMAIHEVWTRRDPAGWGWPLVLAAAVCFLTLRLTPFYDDSVFGRFISGSQALGMLLMWVWLQRRVWRAGPAFAAGGSPAEPALADASHV